MTEQTQYIKMTQEPVSKLILSLAGPTIISMLITSIYNMADTYFVSKLGTSASGAIGIVLSVMALVQAVGFTIGMGSASHVSIFLGEEKKEQADEYAVSAIIMSAVTGIILMLIGLYGKTSLMKAFGSTDTILPYAITYSTYIFIAAPFMCASFVLNNLLRAEGKAKLAMLGILAGGVLNVLLDPILIFGCSLGIAGAGISTAVSQLVSCSVLLYWFLAKKTTLTFSLRILAKRPKTYIEIIKNGIPSFFRQGLASVATVLLNIAAAGYGDAVVAGMSIVNRIFLVLFSIIIGFVQGYTPVVGYNFGADKKRRVKKAFVFTFWVGTIVMSLLGVAVFWFAEDMLMWFIGKDPEAVAVGTEALRYQCYALPLITITVLGNMTYQAMDRPFSSTFMASCRQGIFFIPAIYFLPRMFGVKGIEWTQPVADIITALCCLPFIYYFFKLIKRR